MLYLQVLLFGFNIPVKGMTINEAMEQTKPLMNMVFYCIDKIKRYRLSKEGKFNIIIITIANLFHLLSMFLLLSLLILLPQLVVLFSIIWMKLISFVVKFNILITNIAV